MSKATDNLRKTVDNAIARKMKGNMTKDKAYTVRELTAAFYNQWEAPQEISKYEKKMFDEFIEELEDPNRCQCIGDDGRLLNKCDECPR